MSYPLVEPGVGGARASSTPSAPTDEPSASDILPATSHCHVESLRQKDDRHGGLWFGLAALPSVLIGPSAAVNCKQKIDFFLPVTARAPPPKTPRRGYQ